MKNCYKISTGLLYALALLALTACGIQDTEALVTITLVAPVDATATLGTVALDLDLPTGFILETDTNGALVSGINRRGTRVSRIPQPVHAPHARAPRRHADTVPDQAAVYL